MSVYEDEGRRHAGACRESVRECSECGECDWVVGRQRELALEISRPAAGCWLFFAGAGRGRTPRRAGGGRCPGVAWGAFHL